MRGAGGRAGSLFLSYSFPGFLTLFTWANAAYVAGQDDRDATYAGENIRRKEERKRKGENFLKGEGKRRENPPPTSNPSHYHARQEASLPCLHLLIFCPTPSRSPSGEFFLKPPAEKLLSDYFHSTYFDHPGGIAESFFDRRWTLPASRPDEPKLTIPLSCLV